MKPLFFISSTIRVTHIIHEFKAESVPYGIDEISSYYLKGGKLIASESKDPRIDMGVKDWWTRPRR
jgi:hypothetical protein